MQWVEVERALGPLAQVDPVRISKWEGYLTIQIVEPSTVEAIQENPLGIRITSIAWTRVASGNVPSDSVAAITGLSQTGGIQ